MAGFFRKLFSKEEVPADIKYDGIGNYLTESDSTVQKSMSGAAEKSRVKIVSAVESIDKKVDSLLDLKMDEEAELHTRVKTVVERTLPQFASSMKKIVPSKESYPTDPQEFYSYCVELLKAFTKCMKGPGKYVYAAFPDDIKELAGYIAVIGREINSMNEVFRPALEKKAKLESLRGAYEKTQGILNDHNSALLESKELKNTIESKEAELRGIVESIAEVEASADYLMYLDLVSKKEATVAELTQISDNYHLCSTNAGNVFRKVIYIADKNRDKEFVKALSSFDSMLSAKGVKNADEIKKVWDNLYGTVSRYFLENDGLIKTKSEEKLFVSKEALTSEISTFCARYKESKQTLNELSNKISECAVAKMKKDLELKSEQTSAGIKEDQNRLAALAPIISGHADSYSAACLGLGKAVAALMGEGAAVTDVPKLDD